MIDRRCILKLLGATIIVNTLPDVSTLKSGEKPFPEWMRKQYALRVIDYTNPDDRPALIEQLKQHAMSELPPGTPYEIRDSIPGDFGRNRSIAWYYSPAFLYAHTTRRDFEQVESRDGTDTFQESVEWSTPYVTDWKVEKVYKISVADGVFICERCRT